MIVSDDRSSDRKAVEKESLGRSALAAAVSRAAAGRKRERIVALLGRKKKLRGGGERCCELCRSLGEEARTRSVRRGRRGTGSWRRNRLETVEVSGG